MIVSREVADGTRATSVYIGTFRQGKLWGAGTWRHSTLGDYKGARGERAGVFSGGAEAQVEVKVVDWERGR